MKLQLSPDLALPLDAATQTFGFIARKGAGKTYAAGKLTELLLDAGVQVIVLDTVGNWYGLRLAADGKGDGFDIPVLGGLRGDIPLNAAAGELVADLAVDTGRSLILDLSQFSLADRRRFATAFGVRLWQRKKGEREPTPLHLVIEESQLIIPQDVRGDAARMVGIFEEIVRLGRNYGIGVSLISQRPQSVNKEALNQVECLLAFQVNGTHERIALRDWVVTQGMDVDLVNELPSLPVGTAYVWSPQWLRFLGKVRIAPKKTFDASATPKVGERRTRRELKPLDLSALQERMAAVIEEAQARDPAALRKRIAELERQLQAKPAAAPAEVRIERVEIPIIPAAEFERVAQATEAIRMAAEAIRKPAEDLANRALILHGALEALATAGTIKSLPLPRPAAPRPARAAAPAARRPDVTVSAPTRSNGDSRLSGPQQRILDALASFEAVGLVQVARSNVAAWADASPTSSSFTNNLGALRTAGLIDYPASGVVCLTDEGRRQATLAEPITSLADLHEAWYRRLSGPQRRIIAALVERYPDGGERTELAEHTGASPTSSAYGNNLGALRSLGLIDYPQRGWVVATDLLFPEGLR